MEKASLQELHHLPSKKKNPIHIFTNWISICALFGFLPKVAEFEQAQNSVQALGNAICGLRWPRCNCTCAALCPAKMQALV